MSGLANRRGSSKQLMYFHSPSKPVLLCPVRILCVPAVLFLSRLSPRMLTTAYTTPQVRMLCSESHPARCLRSLSLPTRTRHRPRHRPRHRDGSVATDGLPPATSDCRNRRASTATLACRAGRRTGPSGRARGKVTTGSDDTLP